MNIYVNVRLGFLVNIKGLDVKNTLGFTILEVFKFAG